jgi:hypothetical protein
VTGAKDWAKRQEIAVQTGVTAMAEHKHGSMDIKVQEKTFEGFIRFSVWGAAISIGILIFMALVNA